MRPRYGYGIFSVDSTGEFRQKILFFYWDPEEEFHSSVSKPRGRELELETMKRNMQHFVDLERILVNKKEVRAKVVHVDAGFLASTKRPFVEFLIVFRADLLKGLNVYENYYEEEVAEYGYRVVWVFPENAKVVKAEFGVPCKVFDGRIVSFDVKRGMKIPGYELIEFIIF